MLIPISRPAAVICSLSYIGVTRSGHLWNTDGVSVWIVTIIKFLQTACHEVKKYYSSYLVRTKLAVKIFSRIIKSPGLPVDSKFFASTVLLIPGLVTIEFIY